MLHSTVIASPVGPLTLVAEAGALVAVLWADDDPARVPLGAAVVRAEDPVLVQAAREIGEYFGGERQVFSVPIRFGGTPFQRLVWQALATIPFGETRSYGAIARQIGLPEASRAVGAANGRNPLSIIVPCHRVIGAGRQLTGFAGGLAAKRLLLDLEAADRQPRLM